MANEIGLRSVAFVVDDLRAVLDRLATDGYGLVGGIGQHEDVWLMAYVRGPDGIIVASHGRVIRESAKLAARRRTHWSRRATPATTARSRHCTLMTVGRRSRRWSPTS